MERYFDAFLYVANWGTHELSLRLPRRLLDLKTAKRYCFCREASARRSGDFVILEFLSQEEGGDDEWDDGSGWLSSLIPLRDDLAGGDHRALYLAWLLAVQSRRSEGRRDRAAGPRRPGDSHRATSGARRLSAHRWRSPHGCRGTKPQAGGALARAGDRRVDRGTARTDEDRLARPAGRWEESLTCERSCCEGSAILVPAILPRQRRSTANGGRASGRGGAACGGAAPEGRPNALLPSVPVASGGRRKRGSVTSRPRQAGNPDMGRGRHAYRHQADQQVRSGREAPL